VFKVGEKPIGDGQLAIDSPSTLRLRSAQARSGPMGNPSTSLRTNPSTLRLRSAQARSEPMDNPPTLFGCHSFSEGSKACASSASWRIQQHADGGRSRQIMPCLKPFLQQQEMFPIKRNSLQQLAKLYNNYEKLESIGESWKENGLVVKNP
jgi:hypothetical protein